MELHGLSLTQIKLETNKVEIEKYPEWISILKEDERTGVKKLAQTMENKYRTYQKEIQRMKEIKAFEASYQSRGYQFIAGMDEVGRGPLAGPVVSCAVILPPESNILYINDSKKLTALRREELSYKIKEEALSIGLGIIDKEIIDEINIYEATKQSMVDAVDNLLIPPQLVIIDAMHIEGLHVPQKSIQKGDEKCYSIAAASIVAKVTRDKMMETYHDLYPQYNFKSNKGYGTQEHIDAIHKYGICPIHRMSFLNNILNVAEEI